MAGTASVDALLADAIKKMDALGARMDALETGTGSKNPITKGDDDDDDRKDSAKKADAKKADDDDDDKKDDATKPKNKILDDDDDDKKADAKKRGDDGELEIKHGKEKEGKEDSTRRGDDDDDKKDDAKKPSFAKDDKSKNDDDDDDRKRDDTSRRGDDDDDKKRDDALRADNAALRRLIEDQGKQMERLESLMKPRSDDEHAAFADAQARADAVFNGFGLRAPRPLEGEGLADYRRRLATKLKMHSPQWKDAKLSRMDDLTFGNVEGQIYADAEIAASRPVDLKPGELREVQRINPATGRRENVFYGSEHFVKGMGRPGRKVRAFNTQASR